MLDEKTLLDIINDFEDAPHYKFSISEYKIFTTPEKEETIFIVLLLEEYSYDSESFQTLIDEIKKRIKNILSFDRVIMSCNLKTQDF